MFGDPALSKDDFAAATRVLQIAASALDRLHLVEHAQTFVVLLDRKHESATGDPVPETLIESMPIGWIDVTKLPLADDAMALARTLLRAHAGLEHATAGTDALSAFVAGLAGRPPASPQLVAEAELARRTLDGEGPAALARFVRSDGKPAAPRTDLPPPGSVRLESLGHACFRFTADDGTRLLIDPYSSRYWLQDSYELRFESGARPDSFDKDVVRNWVNARCNPYKDPIPEISRELRLQAAATYIGVFESITGKGFEWPDATVPPLRRIRSALRGYATAR